MRGTSLSKDFNQFLIEQNPFVFFRPIEYSIGSADNSFFGGSLKVTIQKNHVFYAQLLLDEFLLSEWRNNNNWWGNKYAVQIGYRSFDLFELEGLHFLTEYNLIRPYTYSHLTSLQNYGHLNQSLAHPLESNMKELVSRIGYQKNNIDFLIQYNYQDFGLDYQNNNFGGDIFMGYDSRDGDYNQIIGQGKPVNQHFVISRISYTIIPLTNTKFFLEYIFKQSKSGYNNPLNFHVFSFGLSSNLWDCYGDY